ncbi:hypothetical protein CDO28_19605 (plasmid) [Sinorhizobium meliloti]|nr:hypothetical protein CDO28_19605 [Sinorhizobium meliloti]
MSAFSFARLEADCLLSAPIETQDHAGQVYAQEVEGSIPFKARDVSRFRGRFQTGRLGGTDQGHNPSDLVDSS